MREKVDYLIVGQGLAGSLLAFNLLENGKTIRIVDQQHQGAASTVAAGIINPITGRRFAKSWRIDEFLPFARTLYRQLEKKLEINIFHERSVLRFLTGNKDINDWYARSAWEGFEEYMHEFKDMDSLADVFHLPFDIGAIKPAAQVDLPILIKSFQKYFLDQGILQSAKVSYDAIQLEGSEVIFENIIADKVIFCEGQQARFNPWFSKVPFEPAKGEVLFLKIPNLNLTSLLKNKIMIAPLGNDCYWTGSNYEWEAPHDRPTEIFKQDFIKKLKKTLKLPFEVYDHKAAIRPTIKDRRPVMGTHPQYPQLAIFNGLGTKGASIGPFWAKEMVNYLLEDKPLDDEVSINRFWSNS